MADTDKKKLTDKEKAEIAAAAFEEIDAAVEEKAVEEAADASAVADKTPEAAAEATSEPTEVVDPMAGSALGEGLSLLEGSETEAAASEESAEDAVPEEDEAPADDRPEESPEAKEASEDEVPADKGDSNYERVDGSATGMPEGKLSGKVGSSATEAILTAAVEKEEEEPILETVPAESEAEGTEKSFSEYYEEARAAALAANEAASAVNSNLSAAKNVKGYKKQARETRKQAIATLNSSMSNAETAAINARGKSQALKLVVDSLSVDEAITDADKTKAQNLIDKAKECATNADNAVKEARKWQRKRALVKSAIGTGVVMLAVGVVGSAGEIPDAYGHGWWFLGGEAPPPPNDNQIIIDVDDMDVARIQSVLNGVIGNTSVKVEAIKSIQVDADNNYHLILDADKKGTDCLIDINMGEQSGFENTTALVEILMDTELNKDDINTYYALNSFINDEAATANISVAIENQLGSTGTASGGVYAKASYATDRVNDVYNADIDFLVFDEAGNASIMDDAITASSKSDFRSNLWAVVYQAYGGPSTNFDGEIMQHPTITNLTPAQMTIVNVTTGAAVSTGISLER